MPEIKEKKNFDYIQELVVSYNNTNDSNEKNQIVKKLYASLKNLKYYSIKQYFSRFNLDSDQLPVAEASFDWALALALKNYKPNSNARFTTYLETTLRTVFFTDFSCHNSSFIYSSTVARFKQRVVSYTSAYKKEHKVAPSIEMVARRFSITTNELMSIFSNNNVSLDKLHDRDDSSGMSLIDNFKDERSELFVEKFIEDDFFKTLTKSVLSNQPENHSVVHCINCVPQNLNILNKFTEINLENIKKLYLEQSTNCDQKLVLKLFVDWLDEYKINLNMSSTQSKEVIKMFSSEITHAYGVLVEYPSAFGLCWLGRSGHLIPDKCLSWRLLGAFMGTTKQRTANAFKYGVTQLRSDSGNFKGCLKNFIEDLDFKDDEIKG